MRTTLKFEATNLGHDKSASAVGRLSVVLRDLKR